MKILTVIPARGGSKGIIDKNLKKVCGNTLVGHALNCAYESTFDMDVVVSTDSIEILNHAKSIGYVGEYVRPSNLAQDNSKISDVVLDVLHWEKENRGRNYDIIIILQPTSPLRLSEDVDGSIEKFLTVRDATSLVSVNRMYEHPVECVAVKSTGWDYLVEPDLSLYGRQAYNEDYFFINGAIYICSYHHLLKSNNLVDHGKAILYEMPRSRSVDIDTEEDLNYARYLGKKVFMRL